MYLIFIPQKIRYNKKARTAPISYSRKNAYTYTQIRNYETNNYPRCEFLLLYRSIMEVWLEKIPTSEKIRLIKHTCFKLFSEIKIVKMIFSDFNLRTIY